MGDQPQDSNICITRGAKQCRQEQIELDNFSAVMCSPLGEEMKHDDDEADHVFMWDDEMALLGSVDALVEPTTPLMLRVVTGNAKARRQPSKMRRQHLHHLHWVTDMWLHLRML